MDANIVLAEDDHFYQVMLAKNISTHLRRIQVVKSGQEVLSILETEEVDLLIIDYHLADLTADRVLERLHLSGIVVPVIVVTGDESLETEKIVRSCGADYYFVKPIDLHDFEIVVNGLICSNEKCIVNR